MTYNPTVGKLNLVETEAGEIATSEVTVTGSWFQGAIINHLLRSASVTGSLCYLSLYCENIEDIVPPYVPPGGGDGWEISTVPQGGFGGLIPPVKSPEISGSTGYTRQFVTGSFTVYGTSSACAVNTNAIFFNTATSDWGNITHFALTNGSQAGGNSGCVLFYGPLSASRTITAGDIFMIASTELHIQMSNHIPYASGSRILNHYLNNVNYRAPSGSNVYCALYSVPPSSDGTGGTEVTGGGYARTLAGSTVYWYDPFSMDEVPKIPLGGGGFGGGGGGLKPTQKLYTTNASPILFSVSAGTDWGLVKYFALWDNTLASPKLIYKGIVDPQVTVLAPDGFMFDSKAITVYPDTGRSDVT